MCDFVIKKLRLPIQVAPHWPSFTRTAALFRCGMLLNSVHVGEASPSDLDRVRLLYDGGTPIHATNPPQARCPILAISSSGDALFGHDLTARWSDIAPACRLLCPQAA